MSRPTVSVVIAAYNAAWCIGRALDSVFAQSVVPEEVIVCDDGSTDDTPGFIEQRFGGRVTVLRLPHRNAAAARRDGLSLARGQWLSFLDADDWWQPNKIERQLDFLARHPQVRWISSDGDYVAAEGVVKDSWLADYFQPPREMIGDLFEPLVQRCFPLMSSMLVERDAYHGVGGINPFIVYSHDYDLWLRLGARHPGAVMADKLVHYWFHAAALSRNFEARHRDDMALMERISDGQLRSEPGLRAAASVRASALAYKLALVAARAARYDDAARMFRKGSVAGPFRRRAISAAAAALPPALLGPMTRLGWLKGAVLKARPGESILTPKERE